MNHHVSDISRLTSAATTATSVESASAAATKHGRDERRQRMARLKWKCLTSTNNGWIVLLEVGFCGPNTSIYKRAVCGPNRAKVQF